jgi:hypothetical protein
VACPDVSADFDEVCRQAARGIVRDPALLQRVYARSAKVREDAKREFGVQEIGVQIIRSMRDAE